ncbi:MAG: nuclear transport factor 2 family protein [Dehalococcoidia bacterium]|nr:nuclear transport factor 2 family protein [Dehalococcoidia bacterium]
MVRADANTATEAAVDRAVAFSRAMVSGDADALEELLAPDFTYTHMNARVEPRGELIPSVRDGRRNQRMDFEQLWTRSYPGVVLVNGLNHMVVGPLDKPVAFDSHFTAVLVDLEGRWQLVAYHSTKVPEA